MSMRELIDCTRRLITLEQEKIRLLDEMLRCLLVAQLLGLQPKEMGNISTCVYDVEQNIFKPWKGMVFRVTHNGELHEFPITKVPEELWPADLLAKAHRYEKSQAKLKGSKNVV